MISHEHTAEGYTLGGAAFCDWGWCAALASEGCVQAFPQADGTTVLSVYPYCADHGALNRQCIASAARQVAARAARQA